MRCSSKVTMISVYLLISVLIMNVGKLESARILGVFPSISISHHSVFRDLTQELARRGHDLVIITANPAFPNGKAPANITEIDVRNVSVVYSTQLTKSAKGNNNDIFKQVKSIANMFSLYVKAQLKTIEVQTLIADKSQHFNLLIIEACMKPALIFSHFYKAPMILISSIGPIDMFLDWSGAVLHPILYPTTLHQRLSNLTFVEKLKETVKHYLFESVISLHESEDDRMLRDIFGDDIPPLRDLKKNVDMIMLDYHRMWDNNRPVPPNVIYLGALHMDNKPKRKLPKDLEAYLNSSISGVIYMSLGTNTIPSSLSQDKIQTLMKGFSELPYDVVLKWDKDDLPGRPKNVKIFKWLPQTDLLRHPKVRVFIMQGGLQSTSEAILSGVPMIGMPMLGYQWYNVEQSVRYKIAIRLDLESLTANQLINAIKTIIDDESFRTNIIALRNQLFDQPQSALERAVWWTEHIIRHKGGKHLLASGAHVPWMEYYQFDVVAVILVGITLVLATVIAVMCFVLRVLSRVMRDLCAPRKMKVS